MMDGVRVMDATDEMFPSRRSTSAKGVSDSSRGDCRQSSAGHLAPDSRLESTASTSEVIE